jgi:hypothetical protein
MKQGRHTQERQNYTELESEIARRSNPEIEEGNHLLRLSSSSPFLVSHPQGFFGHCPIQSRRIRV